MEKLKQEEEKLKKAENTIAVMTMLKEGTVPETIATAGENYRLYLWLCCSRFNIFAEVFLSLNCVMLYSLSNV